MTLPLLLSIIAILISLISPFLTRQALNRSIHNTAIDRGNKEIEDLGAVLVAYRKFGRTRNVEDRDAWVGLLDSLIWPELPMMSRAAHGGDIGDSPQIYQERINKFGGKATQLGPIQAGENNLRFRALQVEILEEIVRIKGSNEGHRRDLITVSPLYWVMRRLGLRKNQQDFREERRAALEDEKAKNKPIDPPNGGAADPGQ